MSMKLSFHIDKEYEEDLLDLGVLYKQSPLETNAFVCSFDLDDDDGDVLINSLRQDELAEFFGLESEGCIYMEVEE